MKAKTCVICKGDAPTAHPLSVGSSDLKSYFEKAGAEDTRLFKWSHLHRCTSICHRVLPLRVCRRKSVRGLLVLARLLSAPTGYSVYVAELKLASPRLRSCSPRSVCFWRGGSWDSGTQWWHQVAHPPPCRRRGTVREKAPLQFPWPGGSLKLAPRFPNNWGNSIFIRSFIHAFQNTFWGLADPRTRTRRLHHSSQPG